MADFKPISRLTVHTTLFAGIDHANFDAVLQPLGEDDEMRVARPAYPPNIRKWRLNSET